MYPCRAIFLQNLVSRFVSEIYSLETIFKHERHWQIRYECVCKCKIHNEGSLYTRRLLNTIYYITWGFMNVEKEEKPCKVLMRRVHVEMPEGLFPLGLSFSYRGLACGPAAPASPVSLRRNAESWTQSSTSWVTVWTWELNYIYVCYKFKKSNSRKIALALVI